MDKLKQLKVFIRLAERRSFSAVGRDMKLEQSSVSRAISALERDLKVRLVNRSTRSVTLTEVGERYYRRCKKVVQELDEINTSVAALDNSATGKLRVSAPVPFGLMFISPRLPRFQLQYPELEIHLDLNDDEINLVEDEVDVAIRLGQLNRPGIVNRKIGDSPFVTVAAAAYLSRHGKPESLEALSEHQCIIYSRQTQPDVWEFTKQSKTVRMRVPSKYQSNNLLAIKDAATAGLGIARLPLWMAEHALKKGSLLLLLEKYAPPMYGIHIVFPSARNIPGKVKLFADFFQQELSRYPYFVGMRTPI